MYQVILTWVNAERDCYMPVVEVAERGGGCRRGPVGE
jgi:hypothetical protein